MSDSATRRLVAVVLALLLVAAACGSDESNVDTTIADDTGAEPEDAPTEKGAGPEDQVAEEQAAGDLTEVCALAQELFGQQDFPSNDQLESYADMAPPEIAAEVELAVTALTAGGGFEANSIGTFAVFARDDVEGAIDAINAFEEENCGIPHNEDQPPLAPGATTEIEPDANRVDVVAVEFDFQFDPNITAGRTSFVLTDDGAEAHFLGIAKLAEGVDLETALQSEDDSSIEGFWETGIAAPGGDDEEVVTFDLEPGNYAMYCFIPTADGTPHAFLGMAVEFTVA